MNLNHLVHRNHDGQVIAGAIRQSYLTTHRDLHHQVSSRVAVEGLGLRGAVSTSRPIRIRAAVTAATTRTQERP